MIKFLTKNKWILPFLLAMGGLTVGYKFKYTHAAKDPLSDPLKKGLILDSVYGIGMVTASHIFQFKSGVSSTVQKLFVLEGDFVQKGKALLEMEGVGKVYAPFTGTVTSVPVNVGEAVFPQSIVISVVDLDDRYITVTLEQRGALRVRMGQEARISFDSMRDQVFKGKVEAIYSNNNNFMVRIQVEDLAPQLLPGMSGDVAIAIQEKKEVLLVPVAAIDQGKVYVARISGSPDVVEIKVGIIDGAMAEVISGPLQEGDRVILRMKGAL